MEGIHKIIRIDHIHKTVWISTNIPLSELYSIMQREIGDDWIEYMLVPIVTNINYYYTTKEKPVKAKQLKDYELN